MPPIAVLVALADPTRCRIIEILREGPQPVHTLASSFDISRPAISRHLRVLKQARLISEKKVGRENRYALHVARLKPVRDWLELMQGAGAGYKPVAAKAAAARRPVLAPVVPAVPKAPPASPSTPAKAASQMGFDF